MSKDKRIATLWDKNGSDDNENQDHPHGQAFYAGGSEHSGQQILGPDREGPETNRFIENLFQHARRSAEIMNDSGNPPTEASTLPIVFWRNGFTVGQEGELRDYSSEQNRQFVECLRRGETPPELASRVRGGLIDVKLENKAQQDYKPDKSLKAFSGEGHRLGAPSPETISHGADPDPSSSAVSRISSSLVVDESRPITTIQVRLVDNSRMVIRANLSARIGDLVSHIRDTRPQYSETNFVLATTFPAKELTDVDQTIDEAKLSNASIVQKLKR